jgi:LDH2 family malate/lactate/ureidoglycolate dehydrogenase
MALEAADLVAGKACRSGIGAATVRNCGDVARLEPYAERIAERGLIGLVMANDAGSGQVVAPHGGVQPLLSTNPFAAGIPRPGKRPIVFDMATSQIALGAVRAAARRRVSVPADTLVGLDGRPIEAPEALFSGLASLLPLGGLAFGFKGTALGLLIEVLTGGLSGDGLSGDAPDRHGRNAVFLLALDPGAFGDPETFHRRIEAFLDRVRASRPRSAAAPVRIPGEHGEKPGPGAHVQILDALWNELGILKKAP